MEKDGPQFSYTIQVQEINCKINVADNQIKEGADDSILDSTYRVVLSRHDDPDIELVGHYWHIVEFNKINELTKIV